MKSKCHCLLLFLLITSGADMAIVEGILTEAQILGYKGTVDFYYSRGNLIARQWPKKRTIPPTAKESANQSFFGLIQTKIHEMSEPNRDEWRKFVRGTNIIWTDAIRFFNLTKNPDKEILPNFFYIETSAIYRPEYDQAQITIFFRHEQAVSGREFRLLYDLSDEPFAPVVWQNVGEKARRRAIMSEQFRPQFTGFTSSGFFGSLFAENKFCMIIAMQPKQKYLRFTMVPTSAPITERMQCPIYTITLNWLIY